MTFNRKTLGFIAELANTIRELDESKTYQIDTVYKNGMYTTQVSSTEYAKSLAETIFDQIGQNVDDEFLNAYM
ncbi:hypothetical protein ACFQ5J_01270 [Lacticaseibacillus baoqingensis]|uniref:Phage protein n=1 Tax=Lacticaseibacillus baoqingensis TaxID=2486013 RepID=A0ABW4E4G4_9LACO|nr:hypothetical protein [Lacticaseibacillus baoqingensis]